MSESARTPWHLWVVGVLSLLWNAFGAYDYLMTQTQNEVYMAQFTPEQLEYFYGFPAWAVAFWATAVWASVAGSLLLLFRRRTAEKVFLVAMVCMFVSMIYNYVLSDGIEIMGGGVALAMMITIVVVAVALWVYAKRQAVAGVLT